MHPRSAKYVRSEMEVSGPNDRVVVGGAVCAEWWYVTDSVVMGWLATLVLVMTLPVMVVPSVSALPALLIQLLLLVVLACGKEGVDTSEGLPSKLSKLPGAPPLPLTWLRRGYGGGAEWMNPPRWSGGPSPE
jgi:hypothetical protein